MTIWTVSLKGEFTERFFYSLEEAQAYYDIHKDKAALYVTAWAIDTVSVVLEDDDTIIKEKEITLERIKIDVIGTL